MWVPVDACAIPEPVFLGNDRRGTPADESTLDFLSLVVGADRAIPLVSSEAHGSLRAALMDHSSIVFRLPHSGKTGCFLSNAGLAAYQHAAEEALRETKEAQNGSEASLNQPPAARIPQTTPLG